MSKLTAKQQRFVEEYLIDLNATQAAIRAGYPETSARQVGSENLSKPYIQDAIQAEMDKRSAITQITAAKVLSDIERVRDKAETQDELTTALKASELQGKHLKLFTDKIQHEGDLNITVTSGIDAPPGTHAD